MDVLDNDPILYELRKGREGLDTAHEVIVGTIEKQRAEFGDRTTDYVLDQAILEHSMLVMEMNERIERRIKELVDAEFTPPIIGETQPQPKGTVMNQIETPEIVTQTIVEESPAHIRRLNRKYMWKQGRRVVKWSLIAVGTATVIGYLVPDKDTTTEEVK